MSGCSLLSPKRMIEPLPNCFSICASAAAKALALSSALPAWLTAGFESGLVAMLWVFR